jgi:hypothetical protein
MEVITSFETMPEKEKELYEKLIPNSMELLKFLEKSFKGKTIIQKYINVLFSLRSSKDDYDKLSKIVDDIRIAGKSGYPISMHSLHKTIKDYLSNIDSTLDIFQKFTGQLKEENIINNKLNRRSDKVSLKINVFRNQLLHEKVPEIGYFTEKGDVTCRTDISGTQNINASIKLKFENSKTYDLEEWIMFTFCNTKKFIEEITNLALGTK